MKQLSHHLIETSASKPKPETAKRIAAVLGIDWTLLCLDEERTPNDSRTHHAPAPGD